MERIKKEVKERVMNVVNKVIDPKNIETSWENGNYKFKNKINKQRGRLSRAAGARFELKVRKDLEDKGRIVDKWTNNVEFEKGSDGEIISSTGKIIISRKYNPFKKMLIVGTGFPDFISIKHVHSGLYSVIGVEVKVNGILSKEEKEKCAFYLQKGIFSKIWVAKPVKNGKKIEVAYDDFLEKYGEKYNKP
jgi:hypothetical protein